MAFMHMGIIRLVLEVCEKDEDLSQANYRTIWRKFFPEGNLQLTQTCVLSILGHQRD